MANAGNLKGYEFGDTSKRTVSEQREIQSKAGKKSGVARRRQKSMKEAAKLLLKMPTTKAMTQKLKMLGVDESDSNYQMGVVVALLQEALNGNVSAARLLIELVGEDPRQKLQEKELKLKVDELEYKKQKQGNGLFDGDDVVINFVSCDKSMDED